jgi:hypothetical protein
MTDPIVDAVVEKYQQRSKVGIDKYGTTLQENGLTFQQWLNHLQEELMDATLYIQKMKSLLLIAVISLAGCSTSEDECDPNCGILRDKKISFSHSLGSNRYTYTIDNECSGQRYTYTGYSGMPYADYLIGDRICKSDIW